MRGERERGLARGKVLRGGEHSFDAGLSRTLEDIADVGGETRIG